MEPVSISVFISCYNEQSSIVPTIEDMWAALSQSGLNWEIIVTDDASSDGSVAAIRRFLADHPALPVRLNAHAVNQGFINGIFEALRLATGQYFWSVAGDNNVDQDTAAKLLAHVGKADIIIPLVLEYSGRSLSRRVISKTYAFLVRALSGCPITYFNGSSIHRRTDLLWLEDKIKSFAYAANCITRLIDQGCTYLEVPVVYNERTTGKSTAISKKNLKDVTLFFVDLAVRRLRRIVQPRKLASERREMS